MNQLRARALILCASVSLAAGAVLNGISVSAGGAELMLPGATVILALIISGLVLFFADQVAKYRDLSQRAKVPNMTPLFAARVAIFAQSCALSGAIIVGWHLALLAFEVMLYSQRGTFLPVITAGLGLVTGGILLGSGLWAENMCKIPPGDSNDGGSATSVAPRTGEGYAARQQDPR